MHKIQSLNPESIVNHMDLYMTVMFGKSPLKRYQREMMAVVVSGANDCEYCIVHHAEALIHFWKDREKAYALGKDFESVAIDDADKALCRYAQILTQSPGAVKAEGIIKELKSQGFDDRAILDAALVISYFNFVNRMVLGLGVHLEDDGGSGYKYD